MTRLLITDLDNTLYNWVDYFGPAFRAMVHVLSARLDISEPELTRQFQHIYERFSTTEYPFSVQLLPALDRITRAERDELVELALTAFGTSRRKRLRPYAGVRETLRWARAQGVTVAVVTSAPSHVVAPKLNQLGLLSLTSLIVAWEGFELPPDKSGVVSPVRARVTTHELPRRAFRPKTDAYLAAMEVTGYDSASTVVVGDSLETDIAPALDMGLPAHWARYGLAFESTNLLTIRHLTPGGESAVQMAYRTEPVPDGTITLRSFDELQDLLMTPQPSLFR